MNFQVRENEASDGHTIQQFEWLSPNSNPTCIVQVLHGLGEHATRYARFAGACKQRGLGVVAHNHRGHGAIKNFGHYADNDGWDKVIADVLTVREGIAARFPQTPVVLLGHSMGSYIAQCFVMRHGGNIAGLILSASTFAKRAEIRAGNIVAILLALFTGKQRTNQYLNHAGLGKFNKKFTPARTEFDWLSRDEQEVDQYVADPLCGGVYSNQLWADLTQGLLEITSGSAIASIRHDLPILILGGEHDPVGGQNGLSKLADTYRRTGHDNVTLTIYPGGRHEMLNEINRDEVTADIIGWIKRKGSE